MDFFGIGISELFFIVFFCLIFFRPEEIPGIVRSVVTHVKKFRSMTFKVKKEIGDIYHREVESKFEEAKEELEKETIEFRSKLADEYHEINHGLEHIQKETDLTNINLNATETTKPNDKSELPSKPAEITPNKNSPETISINNVN